MDQPGLPASEHRLALAGLARLNWLSGSSRIFSRPLRKLAGLQRGKTVRVLDIACGGGDITIELVRRFAREGCQIEFAGCDLSTTAIDIAQQRARKLDQRVEFFQCDALNSELPSGFDALICSLFLHHLSEPDVQVLLRRMASAAEKVVLVNDLVRSRRGYLLAWLASRLLTRSAIVQYDGPVSVESAFSPAEALALAQGAGLQGVVITRHWPERYLLQWWKP
jgi:2-polyprenyl-3-methyl-5-hydroxy-6-metoxy-1,4-benzoquinol methylase